MSKNSRTLLERAKAIFTHLDYHSISYDKNRLPKSSFQNIGISPHDIEQWLDLIIYIQNAPRLLLEREDNKTYVDTTENKFLLYLRQRFYNPELNYEERSSAILIYLRVIINIEKSKGDEINWADLINDPWEISRPTIINLAERGEEMMKDDMDK